MAEDIEIRDVPGFPGKTASIIAAAENLKAVAAAERARLEKTYADEASNGSTKRPMPIYDAGGKSLSAFLERQVAGLTTAADNVILGSKVAKFTYDRIQAADRDGADSVSKI
ncbi:Uncharacterised protein (plasmid) [Tsukamurella tyrosinosolvens]|uniref:Uncharacterized protein n=1 Tax=Tsukamurella tyrosinosolvens TaxID=57704 RepID=A0A1H4WMW9_TSUTY|nr:hypothetical protein [Tsukamurella tyrosinosolvens]KXO99663.1 hypothetical protein AXK58_00065 [Tsukamurella tyrosinosolvens]SEC93991.1 hypothetical protein SAMN04489793_3597 [Tsukamurella tyrosinosolvens]VEH89424.1 Uncharacterised protein [Tsukamurella tyrosinosolvens]